MLQVELTGFGSGGWPSCFLSVLFSSTL